MELVSLKSFLPCHWNTPPHINPLPHGLCTLIHYPTGYAHHPEDTRPQGILRYPLHFPLLDMKQNPTVLQMCHGHLKGQCGHQDQ